MVKHEPRDPAFEARVRASFARQAAMATLGAELVWVAPGEIDIVLPFRAELTQQHGFLHAGIVTSIADSACGYAALSLMPSDVAVLSVEFKINLLAPASGRRFIAQGRVLKSGRTLSVCQGNVLGVDDQGEEKLVATMLATIMTVRDRPGLTD
jgi:uncharacterized protein (TIGR00369 family)